ncbi:MAG: hypothetical protein U5R06_02120 [candidate division KSB1 bacterium]|nr:hypothetical protein [candidate division KSB1 bacterium]
MRRVREAFAAYHLQCIGTSATLAGKGDFGEQQKNIAEVASQIFGTTVKPSNVIGETVKRVTPDIKINDPNLIESLKKQLLQPDYKLSPKFESFIKEPLSIWIESTFGVTKDKSGRLIRTTPKSIGGENGAAGELSKAAGISEKKCAKAIKDALMTGYRC